MAYIRKRDDHAKTNGPESKDSKKSPLQTFFTDDDLDGEDDLDEDDKRFKKQLNTEFPLSGGETEKAA